jgi:hypothetical protein
MVRPLLALALSLILGGCQSEASTIAACELVRNPAPHVGRMVTIEDVALPAPGGTIAITAIRGCPIGAIQGIEVDLSEAAAESADLLRNNLAEGQRRSRPDNVHGVAAKFTGRVEQGFEGALTLHLRKAENQQIRRADDVLQPGLYNSMRAEPDSTYVSNTVR